MFPHLDRWDRVHANFRVNGTVTGRLSCVQPNLQNIPRGSTAADIKRMFIPPPGYVLMEVDYSQAELRIIAELSGDQEMIDIFRKNYNIHTATACKMSGEGLTVYDKVKAILKKGDAMSADELADPNNKEILKWVKLKKKGKSMNFSIVYQQGDEATAEQLELSLEEARAFKKEWYAQFPGVDRWIKETKKQAHRDEYVYNMFGGKRRLWNINSINKGVAAEAERQAVNAPVQGASGYFTLFSIIILREMQMKGEITRDMMLAYTVHDSIGYYIRPKDAHQLMPLITNVCQNPETKKYFGFEMQDVVMKVSGEVGIHWAALKDYNPEEQYKKLIA
jgi:DNA polymerase-1